MTVAASGRWRNGGVTGAFHCVVAVATIHLQLSGVQLVAEGNRLSWTVPKVDDFWMGCRKKAGREVTGNERPSPNNHQRKFVNPSWEMEFLHRNMLYLIEFYRLFKLDLFGGLGGRKLAKI